MGESALSFGKCLAGILAREDISVQWLADRMGYKSKTSIARILHDAAGVKSLVAFLKRLQESNILGARDIEALKVSLNVAKMGADRYIAWDTLWALFHEPACGEAGGAEALLDLTEAIRRAKSAELIIVNCCDPRITDPISEALQGPSRTCEHYFYLMRSVSRTVRALRALMALVPHAGYSGYAATLEDEAPQSLGLLGGDLILAKLTSAEGIVTEQLCLLHNAGSGVCLEIPAGQGGLKHLRAVIALQRERYQTVSRKLPAVVGAEDYVALNEMLLDLEWQKTTYKAEPDMCLDAVAPEIVIGALRPELIERMFDRREDYRQMLERFRKSHEQRHHNLFVNPCTKHIIHTERALREFAKTGRLADHVFLMRNFTVEERISILQNYLAQARDNGHFNIYIWRDDLYELNYGVTVLDSRTLIFVDPRVDYSLANDPLTVIVDPTIAALISEYFRKELLAARVMPYAEGLAILEELIGELRQVDMAGACGHSRG